MAGSSGSRRRQTRLAFTPLPSSSPAAKGYNKQFQERAAAVSLDGGSSKRRKLKHSLGDAQVDGLNDSIPTPAASLQKRDGADVASSEDDSEPIKATQRRSSTQSRRKSRQQPIDFSTARDPDTFSSPLKLSSPSRPQASSNRAGIFGTQRQRPIVNISSDGSEEDLPSPGKLVANRKPRERGKADKAASRVTRSVRQPILLDSDPESENIIVTSAQRQPASEESEGDGEDDMPTTLGTQRRKRARRASRSSFISSSPLRVVESEDELEVIDRPRKRRARNDEGEGESEDDGARKPKRSRLKSRREQEDLDEDLSFLGPSSDIEDSSRRPRNTQTVQKNARQKALSKLKRKRSGQPAEAEADEVEDQIAEAEDPASDELYESEDRHAPSISSRQMFKEDEYDQEFVDEEDEETNHLGIPEGLPLQYSRYATMKAKELFIYAIEWMVQNRINPAFAKNDEIYILAFKKLDQEVSGLATSKFTSAAWTPAFTLALEGRPDIAYEEIDRSESEHYLRDTCNACNRTNHPATFQIQFQGRPYHRETLDEAAQPRDDDDDDDDSDSTDEDTTRQVDDDSQPAYDAAGRKIPPAERIYYVGKFCMSNARTSHALNHWRYHLNQYVVTWLIRNGYNASEKIIERDGMSAEKRKKHANKIADQMEKSGVIKELWRDFKSNTDEARDSKQGRYRFDSP